MLRKCLADVLPEVLLQWHDRAIQPRLHNIWERLPLDTIIKTNNLTPQDNFLDYLLSKKLPTRTTQALYNFFTYGAENIYQHAQGQGVCGMYIATQAVYAFMYDFGPGFSNSKDYDVPDILTALQQGVSLPNTKGHLGLGLTYTAASVDNLYIQSKGYLWHKRQPKHIVPMSPATPGVFLLAIAAIRN